MILWSIYAIGVLVVFMHILIAGMKGADKLTLGDVFEVFIVSLGSWITYGFYLSEKLQDVVIWRKKKD